MSERHKWTRKENVMVMECYYKSSPARRGFRKRMYELWKSVSPDLVLTEQGLLNQKRAIVNGQFLSAMELEHIQSRVIGNPVVVDNDLQSPAAGPTVALAVDCPAQEHTSTTPSDRPSSSPSADLSVEEETLLCEIKDAMVEFAALSNRPRLTRVNYKVTHKLDTHLLMANKVIGEITTECLTETNTLAYAVAYVLSTRVCLPTYNGNSTYTIPPWKARLQHKISVLRKELSQLDAAERIPTAMVCNKLVSKYHITERGISVAREDARQRLLALSHRLKRYTARTEQYKQNCLFRNCPGKLYQSFKESASLPGEGMPDKQEVHEFWNNIWGVSRSHSSPTSWLSQLYTKHETLTEQDKVSISLEDVVFQLKRMANWKSPGLDLVPVFWLKKLTALHPRLAAQFQTVIDNPEQLPVWLVSGKTTLILKNAEKGPIASNYRPITCLPTMWKLLSGIIASKMLEHLVANKILAFEQKGIRPGSRGTKDQLLIDKMIGLDCKSRRTNLAVAWIDFAKAFDSVPHSWIVETLKLYRIHSSLTLFLQNSMSLWNTALFVNREFMADISIKCGIFQGDSISPLLFCLALNPLSEVIKTTKFGYKVKSGELIQHLLYMDDLKLYARNERDLNSLISTVCLFSNDIGMRINVDKSAKLVVSRGKIVTSADFDLNSLGVISDVHQGYKYLGIIQDILTVDKDVKRRIISEYRSRFRSVVSSHLNGHYKIIAINSYALPVLRYSAGIVNWTQAELDDIDRKSRKLLTIYKGLHPKADVDRLYLPRRSGGRGLINVRQMIAVEIQALAHYVLKNKSAEPLLVAVQQSGVLPKPTKSLSEFKSGFLKDRASSWRNKPLHGQFPTAVERLTTVECAYKWIRWSYLKFETEALLTAAQDQALRTNAYNTNVLHCSTDPLCRLCHSSDETIFHILSSCPFLAPTSYLERHNSVAALVHKQICMAYGITTSERQWLYRPQPVVTSGNVKILWDVDIRTDRVISAHRPDIVIHDSGERSALVIDVAIPADVNIVDKEREKILKYVDLRLELQKIWNLRSIKCIPIVIGVLGSFTPNLPKYLETLPGVHKIGPLLKAALLGSAHLMRRSLSIPELG